MSLPAAPLVPTANNPQSVGHPDTVCRSITATNGLLPGQFPAVSVVQTDLTTPGSSAALELGGGGGAGGPVGASNYILYKTCGPAAGGLVPDHLQLFRYGPTGAVNSTVSEVLDIAPKMVATPGLPSDNTMFINADVTVNGALALASAVSAPAGFKSFQLPGTLIPASATPLGPTFVRPCLVAVSVLATTTPTDAGGRTQNRQIIVSLTFTDTGVNQLTDYVMSDSNPGGVGSNINISFASATGRFSFTNNAAPIEATTISFAILNQV